MTGQGEVKKKQQHIQHHGNGLFMLLIFSNCFFRKKSSFPSVRYSLLLITVFNPTLWNRNSLLCNILLEVVCFFFSFFGWSYVSLPWKHRQLNERITYSKPLLKCFFKQLCVGWILGLSFTWQSFILNQLISQILCHVKHFFLVYFPCINSHIAIVHNALSKIQFTSTDLQL